MSRLLMPCLLAAALAGSDAQVIATPPRDALPDPADLVAWPEQGYTRFAAGSVVDARPWLLDAPAGKHGPLRTRPDGRLEFGDGSPARFWGTTLVYGATFPDQPEEIAVLADSIAAYGYNLVRFHHNDIARKGLGYLKEGKPGSGIELEPDSIDRLDHLAAELIKRGIYLYVDCVDSRPYSPDMEMPGWQELAKTGGDGWKGVWPHPAMVAAWKRASAALLSHKNPYTGRTWAEEPAVAVVEIINENGPFWDWGFKITDAMQQWFDQDWNAWLLKRYGDRAGLAKRWTDATGVCGLFADEDPAKGNVYRPRLVKVDDWDRPNGSKARGACRYNDFFAWQAESASGFYATATAHLRDLGYRGIVMGSHELQGPLNQQAEIAATRTIGAHLYANPRMAWGARPGVKGVVVEGVDVKSNNWFSNIPRVKVAGASGWNGEWTGGSLAYRADVNLAVAGAAAFQRIDGTVHFSLMHRWTGVKAPAKDTLHDWQEYRKAIGMTYTSLHDVPWMAVNRACAAMVERGDLARARYKVQLGFSAEDRGEQNLHALGLNGGTGTIGGAALFLPLLHEVENRFFDAAYDGDADVVFSTGRSASGDYSKAKHAVILGDNPWCDRFHQKRDLAAPARSVAPGLKTAALDQPTEFTIAWPYATPRTLTTAKLECAIAVASLPAGATPVGLSADKQWTLGWCDDRFLVLPTARTLDAQLGDARWLYRFYLAAAKRWGMDLGSNSADAGFYRSDTGQVTIDWASGTELIDSPNTQVIAGFAGWRGASATANLAVTASAPYAVVALTSADGAAVKTSKRLLLVACGRVTNTGQEYGQAKGGGVELTKVGDAPTLVEALRGEIRLSGLADPSLQVFALDHQGRRLGEVAATRSADGIAFALSPKWRTIWFELAAPGTDAPAAPADAKAPWPGEEKPATLAVEKPKTLAMADFLAVINTPKPAADEAAAAPAADAAGANRIVLADMAAWKPFQAYGNLAAKPGSRDGAAVLELDIGKHNQKDWAAGTWFNVAPTAGLKAEDCLGFAFGFQGDGTLPREFHVTIKVGERSYSSANLNKLFEDGAWHDVVLKPGDFTAKDAKGEVPNLAAMTRFDISVVGPLMDSHHVAKLGNVALLTKGVSESKVERIDGLPAIVPLAAAKVGIPFVADAAITADGDLSDAAWKQAVGIAMDEDAVPAWQHVGSFVADGNRKHGEKARFWLLATKAGLALAADIDKGDATAPVAKKDWYLGDCVEVFSDVKLAKQNPTRQLFLAYRRPGTDRAASSGPGTQVGRVRTARGYALEALIPWSDLGFDAMPSGEFGLDLQVDVGDADGRRLQLTLATGTNEAWITAAHFLTVKVATP